eukprot:SAG31_NODE_31488_length_367_cov_1.384328_1_plen_76_part_01
MARKKNKAKRSESLTPMKKIRKKRSFNIVDVLSQRELSGKHTLKKKPKFPKFTGLLIHSDKKRSPNNNQSNGGLQL